MNVKIVNNSHHPLPEYQTTSSAGMDLRAFVETPVEVAPLQRVIIPTGLFIELPHGFEAQVRPRSGLAIKHGITVLNSPGTIDPDYRGEIRVILINLSNIPFTISDGDRIAQMIIARFEHIDWTLTTELEQSERGTGGFGHTGK